MNPHPAAEPAETTTVTLAQITDSHLHADRRARLLGVDTDDSLRGVISHLVAHGPRVDLLLATGDIAQDGSAAAYRRFLDHAARVPAPLHGLPGNHDQIENFRRILGRRRTNPVVDIAGWRIVLLDSTRAGSNAGHLADDQLDLLESAAAQSGARHILIAMHHQPVAMQSAWLDSTMIDNAPALFDRIESLPRVRALLWGHVHQEHDQVWPRAATGFGGSRIQDGAGCGPAADSPHGMRLLATPSTCVQFAPGSDAFRLDTAAPGYRWLKLHADGSIETGVERAAGLNLQVDMQSGGY